MSTPTFLSLWRGPLYLPRTICRNGAAQIVEAVAEEHGVTSDEIRGRGGRAHITRARQHAYAALYRTGRYSLGSIGDFIGGRDHSTVFYGLRRHAERMGEGAR